MTLTIGSVIGAFEITGKLGVGGMGEVFRATDTQLDREVAIKVLPESFMEDSSRVARFEQEAKTLAALNHANIAQIHGLESIDGAVAIVMELVDGLTLAERIAQGPISVVEAIDIAIQVSNAVDAAHQRGIVHRDLKPANIKLRPDGVVKVLDFGIAKTLDRSLTPGGSGSPALTTPALTEVGLILGTAAYMSPEQARGKPIDERTDIWAFGAILYEMLTGQPPFLGEDVTETVAAVLKSEPSWDHLPPLPLPLRMFIKQCLAKDPRYRLHSIADMRLALAGKFDVSLDNRSEFPSDHSRERGLWVRWALTSSLAVALVIVAIAYVSRPALDGESELIFRRLTFENGDVSMARFAPDGQVVVYSASWNGEPYRIYTTRTDSFLSSPLGNVPPADLLAVSNSSQLAVSLARQSVDGWQPRGVLADVNLAGGGTRELEENVASADWGPDGEIAAIVRVVGDGMQVEFPVGTIVHSVERGIIGPVRVSPDGESVCFSIGYGGLAVAQRGGPVEQIGGALPRITSCAWSPGGDEIWFSYTPTGGTFSNLDAITEDGTSRRVLATMPAFARISDVSPTGSVLASIGSLHYTVRGRARAGAPEIDLGIFDATRLAFLSGTGTELLLQSASRGSRDLFLRSVDGQEPVPVGVLNALALTPDSERIAVLGDGSGSQPVNGRQITLVPTGVGMPRTIDLPIEIRYSAGNSNGTNNWVIRNPEFSADGNRLLLPFAVGDDGSARAYVHDLAEGWTRPVTPPGITGPVVLSPDGGSVAYHDAGNVYVQSVAEPSRDPRRLPGAPEAGDLARWSADQQSLYIVEQSGAVATVYARSLETGERTPVQEIRVPDPAGVTRFELWIAADGEAYAYTLDRQVSSLFLLENVD